MHSTKILCITLASSYILKMAVMTGCYENLLIKFFFPRPILIRFALKLFVLKQRLSVSLTTWCAFQILD